MRVNNEPAMMWPFLMYRQSICLQAQKKTKKSVNNSISLTELIRIFTDYKSFASILSHVSL
jgi:hypothetical protein